MDRGELWWLGGLAVLLLGWVGLTIYAAVTDDCIERAPEQTATTLMSDGRVGITFVDGQCLRRKGK